MAWMDLRVPHCRPRSFCSFCLSDYLRAIIVGTWLFPVGVIVPLHQAEAGD